MDKTECLNLMTLTSLPIDKVVQKMFCHCHMPLIIFTAMQLKNLDKLTEKYETHRNEIQNHTKLKTSDASIQSQTYTNS